MKNKNRIIFLGIFVGSLILMQYLPLKSQGTLSIPAKSENIELTNQKHLMVNTAVYYVLSFINHN